MPSDRPHTPQSPSYAAFSSADLPSKPVSPKTSNSLPTPAHSINGSMSSISDTALEATLLDDSSNKRKRDVEDHGDRSQKKVHVEDSRLSIEDLHIDVGDKYLLCRTPHARSCPDTTQDLFELYGFNELAKSVARKNDGNPDGKNIRKTYKSVFKGLSGAFDVNKKEMNAPDTHFAMMQIPDEEWHAQMVRGKDVTKGLSASALGNMSKAFNMARGPIPKKDWNSAVLGDIVTPAASARPVARPVVKSMGGAIKAPISQVGSVKRPVKPQEMARPQRVGKKRTYEDSSYDGYGEGYVDDEVQDVGYSEGDGDGSRKKLKKSATSHANFQQGPMRQQSYGPGMVGA